MEDGGAAPGRGRGAVAARSAAQEAALAAVLPRFKRGGSNQYNVAGLKDKKLRGQLTASEKLAAAAAVSAAKTEQWLLPSEAGFLEAEGLERTFRFSQAALAGAAEVAASRKAFDLTLPALGPYALDYTPNGRHLLLGGRRGHLALMEWGRQKLVTEVQVRETVRAVKFLHNTHFFAAAQEKYTYIYDSRGQEVHCLREAERVTRLDFLAKFFLLVSGGEAGILRWQDTSTGALVAAHRTRLGACEALGHSPASGVALCGHGNGTVTLWSPNAGTPLVSLLAHRGAVRALAVDATGHHLVTAGADSQLRVWDVRTFRPLHAYFTATPASAVDVSQRGMLAVSYGPHVQVWQDALAHKAAAPYLNHLLAGGGVAAAAACFCPYDDVLGVGHSGGVCSMLVPGAGEPNYDSFTANPYETKRQRQEAEVHALLDKLNPAMITLDPETLGGVARAPAEVQLERRAAAAAAAATARDEQAAETDAKKKMKGRRKATTRHRRKQLNVIDSKRAAQLDKQRLTDLLGSAAVGKDAAALAKAAADSEVAALPLALRRFAGRTK